jgi:hypothetical protein
MKSRSQDILEKTLTAYHVVQRIARSTAKRTYSTGARSTTKRRFGPLIARINELDIIAQRHVVQRNAVAERLLRG